MLERINQHTKFKNKHLPKIMIKMYKGNNWVLKNLPFKTIGEQNEEVKNTKEKTENVGK